MNEDLFQHSTTGWQGDAGRSLHTVVPANPRGCVASRSRQSHETGHSSGEDLSVLDAYMTPAWVSHELWNSFMSDVPNDATVAELTCGDGRMLAAVPAKINAFGCEIHPGRAEAARRRTGRVVLTGDVLKIELPPFSTVFGNPPFQSEFFTQLLDVMDAHMVNGQRAGFVLPAYFFQTPGTVMRWNRRWSIAPEMIPRSLFPRITKPLVFAILTKDPAPTLKGMRLYYEADAIECLKRHVRDELETGSGTWSRVVEMAMIDVARPKAHLAEIYVATARRRPAESRWWKEKIRQQLQIGEACGRYIGHGGGMWELVAA